MACENWCQGMRADLAKRLPHYLSDWTDVCSQKILSSTLFIFFTSIAPALTFSLYMAESTDDELGAIEILLSTALTGIIFSVFGGQPLVVLGVTGPVAILTASIHALSVAWKVKFIPLYAWAQIWAGILQVLLSCSNSCSLLTYVTQFSCETFGVLIALIYLFTGLEGIAEMLDAREFSFSSGLLQLIIAIGTALTAHWLTHARHWRILNETLRTLVSDYGATLSVLLWSAVPHIAENRLSLEPEEKIPFLYIPLSFDTTSGRPWLVDLSDIPVWGVFAAILPGAIIALLFFFDHNVSSIIAQHRDFELKKGTAFHWDYFVVGVLCVITGILGIPPTNSLIPQAPLHVKSVIVRRRVVTTVNNNELTFSGSSSLQKKETDGEESAHPTLEREEMNNKNSNENNSHGDGAFVIERVYEQRLTNLLQSSLIGLAMVRPFCEALRAIPTAVLYGLFLFLGAQSFEENEFASRMMLFFTDRSLIRDSSTVLSPAMSQLLKAVPLRMIHAFTAMQAAACALIFGITFTPAEVSFPVFIGLLVIMRLVLLPRLFSAHDLGHLDKDMLSAEEQWALAHPGGDPAPHIGSSVMHTKDSIEPVKEEFDHSASGSERDRDIECEIFGDEEMVIIEHEDCS